MKNDMNGRKFSGSAVPLVSEMGKILINSKDSRNISKAILHLKKGELKTVVLSEETKEKLRNQQLLSKVAIFASITNLSNNLINRFII